MPPMSSLSPALKRDRLIRQWYGGGPSKACRKASRCQGTFWLLADIGILEETHGVLGAQEALRAINRRSGRNGASWTADQVMATGDEATRTHVLSTLYAKMKSAPAPADTSDLFHKLGVGERDGRIVFDDGASLAAIRRRITEPHDPPVAQP
jgi:hypothetical protein